MKTISENIQEIFESFWHFYRSLRLVDQCRLYCLFIIWHDYWCLWVFLHRFNQSLWIPLFLRHGQFSLLFCHCFNYYFLPSYIISLFLAPFYIFLPSALLNDRKVWSFNWTCLHVIPLNACRKSHEVIQSAYMNLLYCNQLHSALTSETVVTPWSPIHLLPMMPNYYVFFRYPSADDITPAPELRLWCFNLNG